MQKTSQYLTFALLALLCILAGAAGQSGRRQPEKPAESAKLPADSIPDPNRDEYQLVYTPIPESEKVKRLGSSERKEIYAATFSDDLSHIGMQGYRLKSIALFPRLAVLRRSDHQYEYAVIRILSRRRFFPNEPDFKLTFASWADKGFRVLDYIVQSDQCEQPLTIAADSPFPQWELPDCTYSAYMVLERRKDADLMPRHSYEVVHVKPTFSKEKLEIGLGKELDNALESNLYPTNIITRFQLLTQSPADLENFPGDEYEVEFVTGNVRKRINELAQQGYRLIVRPHLFEAALMHRQRKTTEPVSYIWVSDKKLEQKLAGFQRDGFDYRMSYGCFPSWAGGTVLIFEQSDARDRKREYKVLPIDINNVLSTNAAQELNRLAKEGFLVRDFFGCYGSEKKQKPSGARVLLERSL